MKTTFGVIVGTRGFFNAELAREGKRQLLDKLDKLGFGAVCIRDSEGTRGLVETLEDAALCAALFKANEKLIDGIIVCLPNFGDEIGVAETIRQANLNVPVLVQACDDELELMHEIANRRDAFCGKLSVCNNLYQYGIKFTNTTQHTCRIDSEIFTQDLQYFASVCRVVRGLSNLRIGQLGTRPAAFQTVRFSEKLLQKSGITVVPVDLSEIIFAAKAMSDTPEVEQIAARILSYGRVEAGVPHENVIKQAKLYLTVKEWMRKNNCAAGTIQCWDSIQKNYGCASCLTMSMLGEEGVPMSCEVDVLGAVTMYALYLASGSPAGYLDWNNSYGDDRNMCVGIHCSNFPKSFVGGELEIGNLDILGNSLGKEKCFGACKATVGAGEMTYAKISTDDIKGTVKVYVGDGEFTDDPVNILGGSAVCRIPGLQTLMDYLCKNAFEHHVAMNRGKSAAALKEALGNYLGWDVYHHSNRCGA